MTNKQKIIAEIERLMNNRSKTLVDGSYWDYKGLIDFINSLPEESVSEDLKEAANFYADTHTEWFDADNNPHVSPAFKAGANWQKEQMIKEAINGIARPDDNEIWCNLASFNLEDGDKVKVIVIKKD